VVGAGATVTFRDGTIRDDGNGVVAWVAAKGATGVDTIVLAAGDCTGDGVDCTTVAGATGAASTVVATGVGADAAGAIGTVASTVGRAGTTVVAVAGWSGFTVTALGDFALAGLGC
jgi:hypothetical protein